MPDPKFTIYGPYTKGSVRLHFGLTTHKEHRDFLDLLNQAKNDIISNIERSKDYQTNETKPMTIHEAIEKLHIAVEDLEKAVTASVENTPTPIETAETAETAETSDTTAEMATDTSSEAATDMSSAAE